MDDETNPESFPQLTTLRQELTENLRFMKRQQWAITNYLILLFGAVYVFHNDLIAPTLCEKTILTAVSGVAVVIGLLLLGAVQCDTERYRTDLSYIDKRLFTKEQGGALNTIRDSGQARPNFPFLFLAALFAVAVAGSILVIWSIWR